VDHPPPYFIRLFEHVAEHQQFYKLMLCGEGVGRFQKLVKDYIAEVAEAKVRELTSVNQHLTVPPAMQVQFFAGAILSLLAWWLEKVAENDMGCFLMRGLCGNSCDFDQRVDCSPLRYGRYVGSHYSWIGQ
jgi:hypothetical protein